jgi:hypothetical protein
MSDAIGHCLSLALEAVVPRSYPRVALNAAAARSFQEIRGAGRAWASKASTQTTGAPFIAAEKANPPLSLMCRVLAVSRSGFHAWIRRHPSNHWMSDVALAELIREIHAESRATYGSPRIPTPNCAIAASGSRASASSA